MTRPDDPSERLNELVGRMWFRNFKATFRHIEADVLRERTGALVRTGDFVDRTIQRTIEGGQCWRDVAASRSAHHANARGAG